MKIKYNAQDFGPSRGSRLRGIQDLTFTRSELIWAAISVGKINSNAILSNGVYSIYEILFRITSVVAMLRENPLSSYLEKTDVLENLDPSEKGAISFFHGLTMSKLFAEKLLETPYLMHLDTSGIPHSLPLTGRSRPDLIGLDRTSNWIVVESKGRSNGLDMRGLIKGKNQTRKLRKVAGMFPTLRVAIQSYHSNSGMRVYLLDPEEIDNDAVDLNFKLNDYLRAYYKNIFNLIVNAETIKEVRLRNYVFKCVDLFDSTITIGIRSDIFDLLSKDKNIDNLDFLKTERNNDDWDMNSEDVYAGSDGIFIQLGNLWSME